MVGKCSEHACVSHSLQTAIFYPKLHGKGLFHQTDLTKTPFTEFIFGLILASLQIMFWFGNCLYLMLYFTVNVFFNKACKRQCQAK